jgi:ankyrin repeat protein
MKILTRITFVSSFIFVHLAMANNNLNLHVAAAEGKLEEVKVLIEDYKYDINLQDSSLGMTALHYALFNEECDVAFYLMNKGAQIDLIAGFYNANAADLINSGYCYDEFILWFSLGLRKIHLPNIYGNP